MTKLKRLITITALLFIVCGTASANDLLSNFKKNLIYESSFDDFEHFDDWVIEGPGKKYIADQKLMLVPDAQPFVYEKWESCGRRVLDAATEYYPAVEKGLAEVNPDMIEKVKNEKGNIAGGHIVCWNKGFETASDYMVEYDFKPLSPIGLGIIFFSAKGVNGEDVLSDKLKERTGIFGQYLKSDINSYHISYWANNAAVGKRGTCNLRKNKGFYCLKNGPDPSVQDLDYSDSEFDFETFKIRLIKIGNRIHFSINGETGIDYTDNRYNDLVSANDMDKVVKEDVDTGSVHGSGRIGLRQMVGLIGLYDNFKVYNLEVDKK